MLKLAEAQTVVISLWVTDVFPNGGVYDWNVFFNKNTHSGLLDWWFCRWSWEMDNFHAFLVTSSMNVPEQEVNWLAVWWLDHKPINLQAFETNYEVVINKKINMVA